jgi:ubiquinone/menaquinone biosynthesis C-methylase UbiE/uncharacterized protein YbaR (Trm112 family)
MLKTLTTKLACPTCRDLRAELALHVFNDGENGHVRDGLLVCQSCRAWYPIEDELLELVPMALVEYKAQATFPTRYASGFASANCVAESWTDAIGDRHTAADFSEQIKQREHFDNYAEGEQPGFVDYTKSRFIRAASRRFVSLWAQKLQRADGWLLDVGCGTANSSFPFAGKQTVIGFDISKKVIRRDLHEAAVRGFRARTTFFVGDGSFLAFKDASFDYVQTFGALHHLPNPAEAISQIHRVLRPGGLYFAVENNKTMFRGLFDFMMRIWPLWVEEAGAEPLISRAMIEEWCRALPVKISSQTSIFIPPHLVNLLSQPVADSVVECTDRLFSLLPIIRNHGGQLIVTIAKPAITGASSS